MDVERPKTRGDCVRGLRPCPWVSCRHHIGSDMVLDGVDVDPLSMTETCTLDVSDVVEDSPTDLGLDVVRNILRLDPFRAREIEQNAIKKILRLLK